VLQTFRRNFYFSCLFFFLIFGFLAAFREAVRRSIGGCNYKRVFATFMTAVCTVWYSEVFLLKKKKLRLRSLHFNFLCVKTCVLSFNSCGAMHFKWFKSAIAFCVLRSQFLNWVLLLRRNIFKVTCSPSVITRKAILHGISQRKSKSTYCLQPYYAGSIYLGTR
jgi:hypothetical protein